jgi:hypothetical protein
MAVLGLAMLMAATSAEARQTPVRLQQAAAAYDHGYSEYQHEHEHRGSEGPPAGHRGATRVRLDETASESCLAVKTILTALSASWRCRGVPWQHKRALPWHSGKSAA